MSKTEINIFLASSINLEDERNGFSSTLSSIENTLRSYDVHLIPRQFEFESGTLTIERSQEKYNSMIKHSDVFIVIFHKTVGDYTKEEFNVAYDLMIKGKLQILLYYKNTSEEEEKNASLISFKMHIKGLNQFTTDRYKNVSDFFDSLKNNLISLITNKIIGKKFSTIKNAYALNDKFQSSLISFNIIKYLVFDRLRYINIWIGNQKIYEQIQHLEKRISLNNGSIKYRDWYKSNADSFNYNSHNQEAVFLTVSTKNEYFSLINNINHLIGINNLIICFDFVSSAISKIYGSEVYLNLLSKNTNVKLFTEKKDISETPFNLSQLAEALNHSYLLRNKIGLPNNQFDKFILQNDRFNFDFLDTNKYLIPLINFILKFGEYSHKIDIINNVKGVDDVIYHAIKTTPHLLECHINSLDVPSFNYLLGNNNGLPILLQVININIKDNFRSIIINKLPSNYDLKKFIESVSIYPYNNTQFWIRLMKHKADLENLKFNDMNSIIKYLFTIISPYSFEELVKIQNDVNLRYSYKLISENENQIANQHLSAIEQNLLLYEI